VWKLIFISFEGVKIGTFTYSREDIKRWRFPIISENEMMTVDVGCKNLAYIRKREIYIL
jgi:hypothetical protein